MNLGLIVYCGQDLTLETNVFRNVCLYVCMHIHPSIHPSPLLLLLPFYIPFVIPSPQICREAPILYCLGTYSWNLVLFKQS